MGLFRLHVRYSFLVMLGSQLLRYGVFAAVAVGAMVAVNRMRGWSPAEVRADLMTFSLMAFGLAAALAAWTTWRRIRRRRYYHRSRYS